MNRLKYASAAITASVAQTGEFELVYADRLDLSSKAFR
jgi:hypothetical protein